MNYQNSLKYQIRGFWKPVITFYIVIILVLVFGLTSAIILSGDGVRSSINGLEFSTAIFIFVMGLNSFKEDLFMLLQNGVSRKTFFLSSIGSFLVLGFLMSVIDVVVSLVTKLVVSHMEQVQYINFFEMLYRGKTTRMSAISITLESFMLNLSMYLAAFLIGFFITISYYRMNKPMKVIISVGVPVSVFIVLPIVDGIFHNKIVSAIGRASDFAIGASAQKPLHAIVTLLITFLVFSGLSWLLMRKVSVQNN